MSAAILAALALPFMAWALHRDLRRADARRRLREWLRRKPNPPVERFVQAWRQVLNDFDRALRPVAEAYVDAFRSLAAAFKATEPPQHRWFKVGEPECECPACPRGGAR